MSQESTGRPSTSETIVAIATGTGAGAIGVVRLSGPGAVPCATPLLSLAGGGDLSTARARGLTCARVADPQTGAVLDEALVVVMPAPRSYTGEDVVEISCHGNPVLLAEVVRLLVAQGARLADPGEFTRRAYLNGKMDLVQAEAVALLIEARTERAVSLVTRQVAGELSTAIHSLREAVLDLIAGLEVSLDFPEDGVGFAGSDAMGRCADIAQRIGRLKAGAQRGRLLQDGLSVMIAGSPNVGKSSLLNALLGRERAIVSARPGTTRDLLDAQLVVRGVPLRLMDGAGIGVAVDDIDGEGMRRSRQAVEVCDLVLVVLDRSQPIAKTDRAVLTLTSDRDRLVVASKCDLPAAWSSDDVDVGCSAVTGVGIPEVLDRLESWIERQSMGDVEEGPLVASLRVMEQLERSHAAMDRAAEGFACGLPAEVVLVDLREARVGLEEVVGIDAGDDVLDRIFATFCVGK